MKVELKGMDARETEAWAVEEGFEPYRGRQVRHWMLQRLALSPDEMSNIPKSLRGLLAAKAHLSHLEVIKTQVSQDGTVKYLFRLLDGHTIESVLIPERDHFTLCISSQAGCAMGCLFCLTGRQGLRRNLSPAEILDQAVHVKRSMEHPDRLTNIVLMGMGEPLANYENVVKAVGNLIAEDGMNFSHRKVTLSTCGLVPEMKRLGHDITVNLAISLNASNDETRNTLMPINRKYPLKTLMAACREFPLPNRRMITFEYILIAGVNDRDEDAHHLAKLLSGIRAKINLIPLNPLPGSDLAAPALEGIHRFQEILIQRQFTAIIRKSKGQDIAAACGQLRGETSE